MSKLKRRLHRLVWVYSCKNVKLLEISCRGSYLICIWNNDFKINGYYMNSIFDRNSKRCSVSRFIVIYLVFKRLAKLWSDCAYAQAGLSLCWLHIPHCWKSHVTAHICITKLMHLTTLAIKVTGPTKNSMVFSVSSLSLRMSSSLSSSELTAMVNGFKYSSTEHAYDCVQAIGIFLHLQCFFDLLNIHIL